jgi:CheY-like chemotaxis protein
MAAATTSAPTADPAFEVTQVMVRVAPSPEMLHAATVPSKIISAPPPHAPAAAPIHALERPAAAPVAPTTQKLMIEPPSTAPSSVVATAGPVAPPPIQVPAPQAIVRPAPQQQPAAIFTTVTSTPPAPPPKPMAPVEPVGDWVLVVDDNMTVREFMKNKLAPFNFNVDYAESGEAAVGLTGKRRYTCVFLDVVMPGIDGYQVCKLIKSKKSVGKTAVVMLTSKGSPFDKIRGAMAGCDAYLTKPVDEEKLLETIVRFIPLPA